jgi:predicted nucleotidyltransferase
MSSKSTPRLIDDYTEAAQDVAALYGELQNVVAVVIGGSLARGYTDSKSDIEMYVYYEGQLPSPEQIKHILSKLEAPLTRSKDVHWHHPAWGHHTFFRYHGINFELGYRDIHETYVRMKGFMGGLSLPKHGIHDTPFGHYESGVASCLIECKILIDKHEQVGKLKQLLATYQSSKVRTETYEYYIKDAKTILTVKAKPAAVRNDIYNFHACIARAVRSLVIALFAVNNMPYPGDKWNKRYISEFKQKPAAFDERIEAVMQRPLISAHQKKQACQELLGLVEEIDKRYVGPSK